MLALVQSVSSKVAVAAGWPTQSNHQTSHGAAYMDESKAVAMIASHYGEPAEWAHDQEQQVELNAAQAGFLGRV